MDTQQSDMVVMDTQQSDMEKFLFVTFDPKTMTTVCSVSKLGQQFLQFQPIRSDMHIADLLRTFLSDHYKSTDISLKISLFTDRNPDEKTDTHISQSQCDNVGEKLSTDNECTPVKLANENKGVLQTVPMITSGISPLRNIPLCHISTDILPIDDQISHTSRILISIAVDQTSHTHTTDISLTKDKILHTTSTEISDTENQVSFNCRARPSIQTKPVNVRETHTKVETITKTKTPVKVKTPAKAKTPVKVKTPAKAKTHVKAKTPAKAKTPVKAKTPAKVKTPVIAKTPAKVINSPTTENQPSNNKNTVFPKSSTMLVSLLGDPSHKGNQSMGTDVSTAKGGHNSSKNILNTGKKMFHFNTIGKQLIHVHTKQSETSKTSNVGSSSDTSKSHSSVKKSTTTENQSLQNSMDEIPITRNQSLQNSMDEIPITGNQSLQTKMDEIGRTENQLLHTGTSVNVIPRTENQSIFSTKDISETGKKPVFETTYLDKKPFLIIDAIDNYPKSKGQSVGTSEKQSRTGKESCIKSTISKIVKRPMVSLLKNISLTGNQPTEARERGQSETEVQQSKSNDVSQTGNKTAACDISNNGSSRVLKRILQKGTSISEIPEKVILSSKRKKTDEDILSCPLCKSSFTDDCFLSWHVQNVHHTRLEWILNPSLIEEDKQTRWKCQVCKKIFMSEWMVQEHCKFFHGESQGLMQVSSGETFSNLTPSVDSDDDTPEVKVVSRKSREMQSAQMSGEIYENKTAEGSLYIKVSTNDLIDEDCEPSHKAKKRKRTRNIFRCYTCGEIFKLRELLLQHKIFTCKFCAKCFKNPIVFKCHMSTHSGHHKPYKCNICVEEFSVDKQLRTHIRTIHPEKKSYKCKVCEKYFWTAEFLRRHEAIHKIEKHVQCDVCGKDFPLQRYLASHMKKHSTSKHIVCHVCGKTLTQKSSLINHMRRHAGIRNYICHQCGKGFFSKGELERHIVIHSDEKPFKCNQCSLSFQRPTKLRNHLKTHIGVLPYTCDVCGKGFVQSESFRKHIHNHHMVSEHHTANSDKVQ